MAGANTVFLVLLTHAQALGTGWHDEACMALGLEFGGDHSDDNMNVSNTTVGDPCLGAVEDPLVGGFVVFCRRAVATYVGACIGFACSEGPELHVLRIAVTLRYPFHNLVLGTRRGDASRCETRSHDGHAEACIAPEHFFDRHRHRKASRVVEHGVGKKLPAIKTNLSRLLHHRPRELFSFIPFFRVWPHDVLREVMDPFLDRELVFVQRWVEISHRGAFLSTETIEPAITGVIEDAIGAIDNPPPQQASNPRSAHEPRRYLRATPARLHRRFAMSSTCSVVKANSAPTNP